MNGNQYYVYGHSIIWLLGNLGRWADMNLCIVGFMYIEDLAAIPQTATIIGKGISSDLIIT